jgi:hypothetical protein
MRCPHCAGEIPAGSRFCGICGRSIAPSGGGSAHAPAPGHAHAQARPPGANTGSQVDSVSLFEMPSSRAGRRARMALVLVLDAILAGAGVVMLLSYLESRQGRRPAPDAGAQQKPGSAPPRRDPADDRVRTPAPGPAPRTPAKQAPKSRAPARPAAKPRPRSDSGARREAGGDPAPAGHDLAEVASEWDGQVDRHQELERGTLTASSPSDATGAGPGESLEGRMDIRLTLMPEGRAASVSPSGPKNRE